MHSKKGMDRLGALLLFLLWIAFNGKVTPEIVLFGAAITLALSLFCAKYMQYDLRMEIRLWKALPRLALYLGTFVKEILLANLAVAKVILSKDGKEEPVVEVFETDLDTRLGRVLLANSITMTPGTITVRLERGEYIVHCLRPEYGEALAECSMKKRIKAVEEKMQ